jgi:hypothetical protein
MYLGLIEVLGSGAIVLGFCAYQLWSLRRDSAKNTRHAEGEHELDDR